MAKLCFGTWAKEHQNAGLVAAWVGEMIESNTAYFDDSTAENCHGK